MSKLKWAGVLAAAALALSARAVYAAETLTILWAQWDPANYLQELVKDYEKVSGVKIGKVGGDINRSVIAGGDVGNVNTGSDKDE